MKKAVFILLLVFSTFTAFSQFGSADQFLSSKIYLSQDKVMPGQNIKIAYEFNLFQEYHINSNETSEDFSIPTELIINVPEGISIGRITYPTPVKKKFSFTEVPIPVYEGKNIIWTTLAVPEHFTEDTLKIDLQFSFQACNDHSCFAPTQLDTSFAIPVVQQESEIAVLNSELFNTLDQSSGSDLTDEASGLEKQLEEKGLLLFLFFVFLGGLALNLTPCVYPLIPITIAYFTNQAQSQKGSHVIHAGFYFAGMVLMYSLLGVIAALSGSIMGAWLQNPIVIIFVALIMVALATSMFGLWEIRVPQGIASFAGKNRAGYTGTLLMGLTVGFIAAPCIGPFVLALITLVAKIANPIMGFLMFLALAMGIGLPYLLLGIFTSSLSKIPKSGGWMIWVRNLFGFVMLAMAVYFLNPLINNELIYWLLMGALAVAAGIYSFVDKNTSINRPVFFSTFKKVVALLLIAMGIYLGYPSSQPPVSEQIQWVKYTETSFENMKKMDKPIIMDFYADWCLPCKELDKFTFSDADVINLSKKFNMIKVDLTKNNDPEVKKIREQFNIKGVPTVLFLDTNGNVRKDLSFVGYINAKTFKKKMEALLSQ
ncbi:MAG: hypothetical protein Kow00108_13260 [Calditrichia bacterium]